MKNVSNKKKDGDWKSYDRAHRGKSKNERSALQKEKKIE